MKPFLPCLALLALVSGCATSIPQSPTLSDSVTMRIRPSQVRAIACDYESAVADGKIKPCPKGSREPQGSHIGYTHSENSTLQQMFHDYAAMKFPVAATRGPARLKLRLKDFWLEEYCIDGVGQRIVFLGGGELNVAVVAHLDLQLEASDGKKLTQRVFHVSGDAMHVMGMGTGTETSRVYRGRDSIEFRVAAAMNAANNKAIAMLNQVIESEGF